MKGMLKRIGSYFVSLFSKKNNRDEAIVVCDEECEASKNTSEVEQAEPYIDEGAHNDHYAEDEYDPFEEKYQPMFDRFADLVRGTRYERYSGRTTSLWAFESLLSDLSEGKTRITAKYRVESELQGEDDDEGDAELEEYVDNRRFEIDAYHIDSSDFEILKRVLEVADVEAKDPEEFERTRFDFEVFQNPDEVAFYECYHPHYSSYNSVEGNRYDDNIDTNGSSLGIMAVRSYLLLNTDTNEFIMADGRYWCL
jgi:hypothetical protein